MHCAFVAETRPISFAATCGRRGGMSSFRGRVSPYRGGCGP